MLNLDMSCPCGSEKKLRYCCRKRSGKIKPDFARIKTPGKKTGYHNPKCYAAALGDCSEDLSGEHYISHGLLKHLSRSGNVEISGFSWQKAEEWKSIPAKKMTSNILCGRHNSALSPLDAVITRFSDAINEIDRAIILESHKEVPKYFLFNGYDVERWMLKTICGVVHSKNASMQGRRIDFWSPPMEWLRILFENKAFPKSTGMFFSGEPGTQEINRYQFEFTPLTNDSSLLDGAVTKIRFLRFILAMTPTEGKSHPLFAGSTFKPSSIVFKTGKIFHAILIWWMHPGGDKSVELGYELTVTSKTNKNGVTGP